MKIIKWRVTTSCNFVMSKNSAKHKLVNETLELETETRPRQNQVWRPSQDRDAETETLTLVKTNKESLTKTIKTFHRKCYW